MSAKSTVTTLRSPSRAMRGVRIFSTRSGGVEACRAATGVVGDAVATASFARGRSSGGAESPAVARVGAAPFIPRAVPQSLQNFAPPLLVAPQAWHDSGRAAPHWPQNFAEAA